MKSPRNPESGFAMLIVFLFAAVIGISLYTQVPRYAFEAQRQKEELLVERGGQYMRAIQLYQRKLKKYPAALEDLEKTSNIRFLRRRYKDPMTNADEWRLIHIVNGQLTDSLVKKPGAKDPNKSEYQNTFITEGPSFGGTNTNNQSHVPAGGALRLSDMPGAAGQMPLPGAPTGTGQQLAGNFNPMTGLQPSQPGQAPYPYPANVYNPNQQGQSNPVINPQTGQPYPFPGQQYAYPPLQYQNQQFNGVPIPIPGGQQGTQGIPSFPLVPGQQRLAGQPLQQQPYQQYMPPGQQGVNPQGYNPQYPGGVQPNGFGYASPVPTYPTTASNSQNNNFGSIGFGTNSGNFGAGQTQINNPGGMSSGGISGSAANLINDLLTKPRAGGLSGIPGGEGQFGGPGGGGQSGGGGQFGGPGGGGLPGATGAGGQVMGSGIAGVASKYEGEGIKIYQDSNLIQEWEFIYDPAKDKANKIAPTPPVPPR